MRVPTLSPDFAKGEDVLAALGRVLRVLCVEVA
jgi:hypothetical protein